MKFIQFKKARKTKGTAEGNVSETQTQSDFANDAAETAKCADNITNQLGDNATSKSRDDTRTQSDGTPTSQLEGDTTNKSDDNETSQSCDEARTQSDGTPTNQLEDDKTNKSDDNETSQSCDEATSQSRDNATIQSSDDLTIKSEINETSEKQNEHENESPSVQFNDSFEETSEDKNAGVEKILEADENGRPIHRLRVSSLYKTFGRKTVVKGIDFSMSTGEVLGLLGPNGAGKTTTFYMIVGFYQPSAGDIFLNDEQITGLPMFKRARLGISYLPQEPSVFKKLTVEENIWSILETRNDLSKSEKKQRLEELIEEFAIARIRKQPAFTLSGGERRRTEIARSLAIEPKFLLLDEPFAGIDPIAVADIKGMIGLLAKRGIGILITDHNVRDTLEITDRAIIVSTGQIAIQGTKQEILDSELAREVYLGKDFSM